MTNPNHAKLSILIVDDQDYMRKLVSQYLSKITEVVIIGEASSGEEALQQVEDKHPDIVLLDMSMPNTSGVEVAKKIKSTKPAIRVYFFSAYDVENIKNLVGIVPADGFIQKSSLKTELYQMVQNEIQKKKGASG